MNSWTQLLNRTGWLATQNGPIIALQHETKESMDFLEQCLQQCLQQIDALYKLSAFEVEITSAPVEEAVWLQAVDVYGRGATEMLSPADASTTFNVRELDTYIAGVVRQLNRLTFYTSMSCDGHGKRYSHVVVPAEHKIFQQLTSILQKSNVPYEVKKRGHQYRLNFLTERAN